MRSGRSDHRTGKRGGTLEVPVPDLYVALDRRTEPVGRRSGRRVPTAGGAVRLLIAALSFAAGIGADAAFLHLGHKSHSTGVVIGERVIRQPVAQRAPLHPPPTTQFVSLLWGPAVLVDPSASLQSISCPTYGFCAAVDSQGQALRYLDGAWSPPRRVDGDIAINSVSCTDPTFCVAVDQKGNALRYDGTNWSAPQRIDRMAFPELTTVSCSTPSFCAAMDGNGYGLTYNGKVWSSPQQVDPQGWSPVSHDVPAISCPTDGFCVGVDPLDDVFFYAAGFWQTASPTATSGPESSIKYDNAISCSSGPFCIATQNPGQLLAYNGTQWSAPVSADASNYLGSISCPSSSFCVAVDSLLPAGYNDATADGNGQVVVYNGTAWSAPQQTGGTGIVSGISCATTTFCAIIDESGHVLIGGSPPARQSRP